MRIAHVAPSYHPFVGGAESHLKAVSEGLARRGHELLVVTQQRAIGLAGNRSVALPREEVVNGVRILRLDADGVTPAVVERTVRWPGGYRLARAALGDLGLRDPEKWSAGFRARRAIRTFRPDVVGVVNWYFGGMAAGFAIGRRPGFARR